MDQSCGQKYTLESAVQKKFIVLFVYDILTKINDFNVYKSSMLCNILTEIILYPSDFLPLEPIADCNSR